VSSLWLWTDLTTLPNGWDRYHGPQGQRKDLAPGRRGGPRGLPNRRHILDLLNEALSDHKRTGSGFCLAVIDIDRFKGINDTYGHDAGDTVLQHFATVCNTPLRQPDRFGRMGGEEFQLLFAKVGLDDAVRIIERVRDGFPPALLTENTGELAYALSAGVAARRPKFDPRSRGSGLVCRQRGGAELHQDRLRPGHLNAHHRFGIGANERIINAGD
jgi:diguanylate cyclase (GGDEF)-like protein